MLHEPMGPDGQPLSSCQGCPRRLAPGWPWPSGPFAPKHGMLGIARKKEKSWKAGGQRSDVNGTGDISVKLFVIIQAPEFVNSHMIEEQFPRPMRVQQDFLCHVTYVPFTVPLRQSFVPSLSLAWLPLAPLMQYLLLPFWSYCCQHVTSLCPEGLEVLQNALCPTIPGKVLNSLPFKCELGSFNAKQPCSWKARAWVLHLTPCDALHARLQGLHKRTLLLKAT